MIRQEVNGRFIPTHVGNTVKDLSGTHKAAVHPHARGEHSKAAVDNLTATGSSPRTWGTPANIAIRVGLKRFIPTHVGNTR